MTINNRGKRPLTVRWEEGCNYHKEGQWRWNEEQKDPLSSQWRGGGSTLLTVNCRRIHSPYNEEEMDPISVQWREGSTLLTLKCRRTQSPHIEVQKDPLSSLWRTGVTRLCTTVENTESAIQEHRKIDIGRQGVTLKIIRWETITRNFYTRCSKCGSNVDITSPGNHAGHFQIYQRTIQYRICNCSVYWIRDQCCQEKSLQFSLHKWTSEHAKTWYKLLSDVSSLSASAVALTKRAESMPGVVTHQSRRSN